jgi:internalin A
VTDLSALSRLPCLQILNLLACRVTDLSGLSGLSTLQWLNLSRTAVTDLSALVGLPGLQSLHLGATLTAPSLQPGRSLEPVRTEPVDLSALSGLPSLQKLSVVRTEVTDLTPLSVLPGLQSLNLYACRPAPPASLLRLFADHPRLTELYADEASGVPREVLSHGLNDNCLPRLRSYFDELKLGAEAENEVKLILLGNGQVGKTQLCRRFRGESFDESVPSTHGVQVWREALRLEVGGKEQVFQVNWWDFGGQDIYHGTHALFLRSRAVFLILWTPGLENRAEYEENGIPLRNQPLAYWLGYVRSLAGKDSPVIVVQSQCDRFADRLPPPARPDRFEFFASCS